MFPVVNEMENPTASRCNAAASMAVGTAMLLYSIAAGAGYGTYGDEVDSNVLSSYPGKLFHKIYIYYNTCTLY